MDINNDFNNIIKEYHSLHYEDLIIKINEYNCKYSNNFTLDLEDNEIYDLIFLYLEQLGLEKDFENIKTKFNISSNKFNLKKLFILLNFIVTNEIKYENYFKYYITNQSITDIEFNKILNYINDNNNIDLISFFQEFCKLKKQTIFILNTSSNDFTQKDVFINILRDLCNNLNLNYTNILLLIENKKTSYTESFKLNEIMKLLNLDNYDDTNTDYHKLLAVILALLNINKKLDYTFLCNKYDKDTKKIHGIHKQHLADVKNLVILDKFFEIYKCFNSSISDDTVIYKLTEINYDDIKHSNNMNNIIDKLNDFIKLHKSLSKLCYSINQIITNQNITDFINLYTGNEEITSDFFKHYLTFCKLYKAYITLNEKIEEYYSDKNIICNYIKNQVKEVFTKLKKLITNDLNIDNILSDYNNYNNDYITAEIINKIYTNENLCNYNDTTNLKDLLNILFDIKKLITNDFDYNTFATNLITNLFKDIFEDCNAYKTTINKKNSNISDECKINIINDGSNYNNNDKELYDILTEINNLNKSIDCSKVNYDFSTIDVSTLVYPICINTPDNNLINK